MKTINVLSVDWDYMVEATSVQRCTLFPDVGNEDVNQSLLDYIWRRLYSYSSEIDSIEVDAESLDSIMSIISSCVTNHTNLYITDSHKYAFDAVSKVLGSDQHTLNLVNVDFHHDCYDLYGEVGTVNCGNWVNALFDPNNHMISEYSKYTWIKRDDSDDFDDIDTEDLPDWINVDTVDNITMDDIDVLFICRSGVWSPPHLDEEFIQFCENCIDIVDNAEGSCVVDLAILDSRYTPEFQEGFHRDREMMSTFYNHIRVV